jgi:predicted DNA-binding protein
MVSLRLDPATDRKLTREAKRTGQTKAAITRAALLGWLDEQEDIRIAEERLRQPGKRIPLEVIARELGLAR